MSALNKDLLQQVIRLQVAIIACIERMRASTDAEALHDLRINLRKLRSLIKPLKALAGSAAIQQSAAALGRLTGPLRDLEVLQTELEGQGCVEAAQVRAHRVSQGYAEVVLSEQISLLVEQLQSWPANWLSAKADGELQTLSKSVRRRLRKDQRRLYALLMSDAPDWHQLRLLIKRVRYGAQAYPQLCGLSVKQQKLLKRAQSQLGTWHDHLQWLQRAEHEADLQPCVAAWKLALYEAESACAGVIERLQVKSKDFRSIV